MRTATIPPAASEAHDRARYQRLQRRLDRSVTGAPDSPTFQAILRRLFTPEEAELAARIPAFTSLDALAAHAGITVDEVTARIDTMARKGLVLDVEVRGHRMVVLAPVVIGIYEFTFMRTGDGAPDAEIAALFEDYFDEGLLPAAVFRASTQIGRSLVREEALPDDPTTEVLDWERTSRIIGAATSVAVSNCPCRVHAHLLGRGCDAPVRTCLTLGSAADAMVRSGLAEAITNDEALAIVQACKAAGLAQTADNVRHDVGYICNCCGCCCGMMRSIKQHDLPRGIVSSNWVAAVDHERCRGCGRCVRACPVGALHLELTQGKGLRRNWAVLDADRCLGCGVCGDACRYDAHAMAPRPARRWVPEHTMERMVAMAIERGKVGDLLYDLSEHQGVHAVARALSALEHTPLARRVAASEQVRSTFLRGLARVMAAG